MRFDPSGLDVVLGRLHALPNPSRTTAVGITVRREPSKPDLAAWRPSGDLMNGSAEDCWTRHLVGD